MKPFAKLACPLAVLAILAAASVPAKAQFGGLDESQMEQFAPMLEMMKQKMGKQRFGQMMQMMGPMLTQMEDEGGFSAMMSGGGVDIGQIVGMAGSMQGLISGPRRKTRRPRD